MRWTIPNILTVMRLAAAPGVALAFVVFERPAADWIAITLFIMAALTDYVDGRLARAWKQESAFGRMLDPIADKAMVVIALAVIVGLSGIKGLIMIPIIFILLREVFVSGLREFLGAKAAKLKVTYLAKWKTTVQMVAIPVLLLAGVFEYDRRHGDPWISLWFHNWVEWLLANSGLILIWVAGFLTVMTGYDYLMKALPFLKDRPAVTLDVRYFAWLRERIGVPGERVETEAATVAELVGELRGREERYALALSDLTAVRVAVDQELAGLDTPLAGVREVAFFPPMTGG